MPGCRGIAGVEADVGFKGQIGDFGDGAGHFGCGLLGVVGKGSEVSMRLLCRVGICLELPLLLAAVVSSRKVG